MESIIGGRTQCLARAGNMNSALSSGSPVARALCSSLMSVAVEKHPDHSGGKGLFSLQF